MSMLYVDEYILVSFQEGQPVSARFNLSKYGEDWAAAGYLRKKLIATLESCGFHVGALDQVVKHDSGFVSVRIVRGAV